MADHDTIQHLTYDDLGRVVANYYNVYQSYQAWVNSGKSENLFPKHYVYHRYSQSTYYYGPNVSNKLVTNFF